MPSLNFRIAEATTLPKLRCDTRQREKTRDRTDMRARDSACSKEVCRDKKAVGRWSFKR